MVGRCRSGRGSVEENEVKRGERLVLVGIVVAVALALRAAFVALAVVPEPLRADAGEYARYAHNLVVHGVYSLATSEPPPPDSFRSPGYPWFLAVCRWLGGESGWLPLALWLQVGLGAATAAAGYSLVRRVVPFWAALCAALATAFSPHLAVASGYVLTECLTAAVLTGALALLVRARPAAVSRHLLAGLAMGMAVLCNETLLPMALALAVPVWRSRGGRVAAAFALAAVLPFGLWQVRNQTQELARAGTARITASISHGSYPGMVYRDPRLVGFPYREDPAQPAFGASWHDLWSVLGPRVAAEPARYLSWYLLEKPLWLWRWDLVQGRGHQVYPARHDPFEHHLVLGAVRTAMAWLHVPIMLLAAVAALATLRWPGAKAGGAAGMLGAAAIVGTLVYLPVIPDPRYLQPIRPVLFGLAALAVAVLVGRLRPR